MYHHQQQQHPFFISTNLFILMLTHMNVYSIIKCRQLNQHLYNRVVHIIFVMSHIFVIALRYGTPLYLMKRSLWEKLANRLISLNKNIEPKYTIWNGYGWLRLNALANAKPSPKHNQSLAIFSVNQYGQMWSNFLIGLDNWANVKRFCLILIR